MTKAATAAVALLALGACGSHVTSDNHATTAAVPQREAAGGSAYDSLDPAKSVHGTLNQVAQRAPAVPTVTRRSLIHTGQVELRSNDVAGAAGGVRSVAARYGGRIDDEQTEAAAGKITRETLTVRVPSGRFAAAFDAIKRQGTLRSASSSAEDVTTQVIDVGVRVRAEKASLLRIEQLMGRARTLGQVIALETQLTQRQSALNALEQKQAYLKDQTTMSTVTVTISRSRTPTATTPPGTHRTGFLGGLHHGWHALVVTATAVAAGVGAVLPFGVPALLIGIPAWLALRRRRRTPAAP